MSASAVAYVVCVVMAISALTTASLEALVFGIIFAIAGILLERDMI